MRSRTSRTNAAVLEERQGTTYDEGDRGDRSKLGSINMVYKCNYES